MEINGGLILPFRFYDNIEKQMRYRGCGRYNQDQIRHNEYLLSYGCRLLPFQIIRVSSVSTTKNLSIVSISTGAETDLTSSVNAAEWDITTIASYDYITYFGKLDFTDVSCPIENDVFYAKFNDGTSTWYSELFRVVGVGCDEGTGVTEENYRMWNKRTSQGDTNYREWDGTDLRIFKD